MVPSKNTHLTSPKANFIVIALFGFLLTGCDNGSVFNTKQLTPDDVSRIEAAGFDLRLYEFTPKTAPNKQCVFVAGDQKGGLTCFDKEVRL